MSKINEQEDELVIGPVEVLESPAGYYIGRYSNQGPYERLSIYFDTQEKAVKALPFFLECEEGGMNPEMEEQIFEIVKDLLINEIRHVFSAVEERINNLPF